MQMMYAVKDRTLLPLTRSHCYSGIRLVFGTVQGDQIACRLPANVRSVTGGKPRLT